MLNIVEINDDLFTSKDQVYAHCVSTDFNMGVGIALLFRRKYGKVGELIKQNVGIGGCAVLQVDKQIIYYLVTKDRYWHKPTYDNLKKSLLSMKEQLARYPNIKSISMPKIGCGLDKLDWNEVKVMLETIFTDSQIETINVYYL